MTIRYCTNCVVPSTRPGISFDSEGVCSACQGAREKKKDIDWDRRKKELLSFFDRYRTDDPKKYDCIVPVSGGKDSIYQVHLVKNVFGMHPLCVTYRTDSRTSYGEHNIQALRNMGVDHVDFTPNTAGFRKLCRKTFEKYGDSSLADHFGIYCLVPRMALRFGLPLVIFGENPDMEYGADADKRKVAQMNREWIDNVNILKGTKAEDWVDDSLSLEEVRSLMLPSSEELDGLGYTPLFLGYYIPWDAKQNVEIAEKHGFLRRKGKPIFGLYDYADLDCMRICIHHYFKWLKFGFNRFTDHCSNEIRKGRMTRDEAIELVRKYDGQKPPIRFIEHFCEYIGITQDRFWEIAEKFRNKDIWKKDENDEWYIDGWIGGGKVPDRFPHSGWDSDDENIGFHYDDKIFNKG
jgi:N-acetyl sugar amidotransferase